MSVAFLKGYRALDVTGLSGQLCGRMLADLGMEVIKIEPPGGDPVRNLAPFIRSAEGKLLSTTFAHLNAGKASKVLDLDREADRIEFGKLVVGLSVFDGDRDLLRDLAEQFDVGSCKRFVAAPRDV